MKDHRDGSHSAAESRQSRQHRRPREGAAPATAVTSCCPRARRRSPRPTTWRASKRAARSSRSCAREQLSSAAERAAAMKDFKLTIHAKAGTEGKLFGSIGTSDIAEAATRAGFKVERSEVRLPTRSAAHRWASTPSTCTCTPTSTCHCTSRSSPKSNRRFAGTTRWRLRPRRAGVRVRSPSSTRRSRRIRSRPSRPCSAACCSTPLPGTTSPTGRHRGRLLSPRSPADLRGHRRACRRTASPAMWSRCPQHLERTGKLEGSGGLAYLSSARARHADGRQRARLRGYRP